MYTLTALLLICSASFVLPQETPPDHEGTALPSTTAPPMCSPEQQSAFLSTLPNAAVCGASLVTVSSPPESHPHLVNIAFDNFCTRDCAGALVEFQDTVCDDELAAESFKLFCTRSNGTAAVGDYCRFAFPDMVDPTILTYCENSTADSETPCPARCKDTLIHIKQEWGCCYQNIFNNTLCVNNSILLEAGAITLTEFETLKHLSNPAGNPWTRCGVKPPERCTQPVFMPPPPPKCSSQSDSAFVSFLEFPEVCGHGLQTVFSPPANDSMMLATALENVCVNNCGGVYANYRKTTCDDELGSESLHIFCTLTNGSAAVGTHCRYAVGDILDSSLFDSLYSCYDITPNSTCPSECRNGLLNLKAQIGCCYQNVYNNTVYLTELFSAGLLTASEFIALDDLNNPAGNPWTLCEVEPPNRCEQPPFTLPPTPMQCSLPDQRAYLLTIPNGVACGNAIGIAYLPPKNDSKLLSDSVDYLCTNDCGGVYTNYQESVCNDELGAESVRVFCSPTSGTATVGPFCYYAAGEMLQPSLLASLSPCYNYCDEIPCSDECRNALLEIKSRIGCCYQTVYNNTMYNTLLLEDGFISQDEFYHYHFLNDPASNPWSRCDIDPPQSCEPPPFKRPPPLKCTLDDQVAFVSTLPNAAVCGPSIAIAFSPPQNDPLTLTHALENVCTDDCGGAFTNYLDNVCNDELAAESLEIFCTPTDGSAAVGDYCRYAVADVLGTSLLDALISCYNSTAEVPCIDDCRAALLNLKTQVGCCYQNIYNNTAYYTQLLYAGLITPRQFTGFFDLNIPRVNPWTLCDIAPPRGCDSPPFQPPVTPKCTVEDKIGFLLSLPNGQECNMNLQTVSLLSTDDPVALKNAFNDVCTNDCGGVYTNYLEDTCSDHLAAENTRLYCVQTNGSASVGRYCRHAIYDVLDPSLFMALATCSSNSTEGHCTAECRQGLINLKAAIGCCYQNVYNNTPYFVDLLEAGTITPSFFTQFIRFNDPVSNTWIACNVKVPKRCPSDPLLDGCPRGTYLENLKCQRCPANTNITLTGGDVTICPCLKGYYRASQEGPSVGCSAPPSACRNIQASQIRDAEMILKWKRPIKTGRNDFYYEIEYSEGDTTGKHTITNQMEYVAEELSNLRPDTMYTFTVTVENGVSDQDIGGKRLRSCILTATTMEGRPSPPRGVQAFCSVVGWRMPLNPNGKIIGYDVQLMRLGGSNVMLSTDGDGTFLAIENEYQMIGTTLQVRAKTSAGAGSWSQKLSLGCTEAPTPTCPPCDCTTPTLPTQGVYFILEGEYFGNNSRVSMDRVGEGEDGALICKTDKMDCCGTIPNRFGQFYYPHGDQVPIKSVGHSVYRNRGDQVIRLNRRDGATLPTGKYRCEIPDASGEKQNIYITLE